MLFSLTFISWGYVDNGVDMGVEASVDRGADNGVEAGVDNGVGGYVDRGFDIPPGSRLFYFRTIIATATRLATYTQ